MMEIARHGVIFRSRPIASPSRTEQSLGNKDLLDDKRAWVAWTMRCYSTVRPDDLQNTMAAMRGADMEIGPVACQLPIVSRHR
ncbi:hypothetical protein [Dongia sp.]|uniref:hypothetical protein n=1 Tax=Dongia sp. TaxID=1977262 RepID=UPI0035AFFFF1